MSIFSPYFYTLIYMSLLFILLNFLVLQNIATPPPPCSCGHDSLCTYHPHTNECNTDNIDKHHNKNILLHEEFLCCLCFYAEIIL